MKHLDLIRQQLKKLAAILALAILFTSCAFVKVNTLYDKNTDFSQYKTFCWLQGCEFTFQGPERLNNPETIAIFQNAIIDELAAKGFVHDENDPDFMVDFHIIVEEKSTVLSQHHIYDNDYVFWYPLNDQVYHYLDGSIIIDIADHKASKMVWRSDAQKYLEQHPDVTEEKIRRAIKLALKKFPPKQQ